LGKCKEKAKIANIIAKKKLSKIKHIKMENLKIKK